MATESPEIDINLSAVQKCAQASSEHRVEPAPVGMEVVDVVLKPDQRRGDPNRVVDARNNASALFFGREAFHELYVKVG